MSRTNLFRLLVTAVILLGSLSRPALAASERDAARPAAAASNEARARQLAADVRELATAPGLSRAKRERRVATAVRTAVIAATAYRRDATEVLGAATELAAAAAQAAPAYAEVITNAAALAPGVARIDGAAGAIRAAAASGARGDKQRLRNRTEGKAVAQAQAAPRRRPGPVRSADAMADPEPAVAQARAAQPDPEEPGYRADDFPAPNVRGSRATVPDQRVAISLTTDLTVQRDDNVYLSSKDTVADTTITAVPGISMRWGQSARSGGNVSFSEAFNHYVNDTSPRVSLARGALNAGYEGAVSSALAGFSYQQLYQSTSDGQAVGRSERIRTNLTGANASFQMNPWTKIGMRVGGNYADTKYRTGGLLGNRQLGLPLDVLFHATPKTDLSLGYRYGSQRLDGGGSRSKDHYFNLGASGEFTAKLSGLFNVGYQTRQTGENPSEHMLAFTGSFDYALTPKSSLSLSMNRNFNASALGASTKNTAFRLGVETSLTSQWRLAARAAFLNNQYGQAAIDPKKPAGAPRTDRLWETDLTSTYLFTDWFSTSLSYFFRKNHSTLEAVNFSSNAVSLSLGLRY